MYCPFKFNEKTLDADGYPKDNACQCQREGCELWEQFTGTQPTHIGISSGCSSRKEGKGVKWEKYMNQLELRFKS